METRRKTLVWGLATSLRFHWVKEVGEQPIDWQNCETGALNRSHLVIRSSQIKTVFVDGKQDISRISMGFEIETRAHLESTRKRALR
jgi:hypothetical protein